MATILVIDDDASFRALARLRLEKMGHVVVEAADGSAGIEVLRHGRADVALVDIFMPEKDGLETIREMRDAYPGCGVIAVSAGGMLKDLDLLYVARQFGADEVLVKPFTPTGLQAALDRTLGILRDGAT